MTSDAAKLSPLPLLLRGRWLYRYAPLQDSWTREALDGTAPARTLTAAEARRVGPLLAGQLVRHAGLGPAATADLALAACRRLQLDDLSELNPRLPLTRLPARLVEPETDRFGRPLRLLPEAAHALQRLRRAASADGIEIDVVSGFRSPGYQAGLWQRKLARGQSATDIARVSAPPGRSEHHSGRAVDLASGPGPVLEASFGATPACRWLRRHAAIYGFVESYPKGNPFGVIPEPWHWCWQPRSSWT
jgi:D-alanyl-D-alanine carboxypeptidase